MFLVNDILDPETEILQAILTMQLAFVSYQAFMLKPSPTPSRVLHADIEHSIVQRSAHKELKREV